VSAALVEVANGRTSVRIRLIAVAALATGVLVPVPAAPAAYAVTDANTPVEAQFGLRPSCDDCDPPPPTFPGQIGVVSLPTSTGTGVVVHPSTSDPASLQGVTVRFANVSSPGSTTIGRFSTPPGAPPPTGGFVASSSYYDITTTATFSGPIDLELQYAAASLGIGDLNSLASVAFEMQHYENGAWVNRTTDIDPVRHVISGRVPSLSPFAVLTTKAQLAVSKAGPGTGTVTSSVAGIACGADCAEVYDAGSQITLTAAPAIDSTFGGWSGPCGGTGACQVTIDAAKTVTAIFQRKPVGVGVGRAPGVVLPNGDRILAATLTARSGCGTINHIQFGNSGVAFANARVGISSPSGGPAGQTSGFTYTPSAGTTSVTLTIERVTPSGGAMVSPILFYDGCGEWRTFVGGGPTAFR
jgi:hypothetical protein